MTRMDAGAGRGGGQRRPGVGDAGDARPRAGSARPRRVGRVLAPGARREPASRASRGAREKRFKRRARDGGFPPARCFVGSAAEREKATRRIPPSTPLASTRARRRDRGGIPRDRAGIAPLASASRATDPSGRGARAAPPDHRAAKSPGRLTWVREGSTEKRPARARAPRTSRRPPTRSARIRSPSARRRFARRALTGRCACVVRRERAAACGARARGCRSLGAGKRFRSGHAKPRFPARGGHKSAVSVREISGESKSPIARPHVESRRMGPIATCRHGSKTQIDRSPLRFQATVTSGFSRDPLERFDSPDRTRDRPLRSDGSTIRRFTHRGFFRPARDRPRIAKPNPRSGAPRSRVGTKSTERS